MNESACVPLLRDRRLWLLLLASLLAIALGFFAIPDRPAIAFVSRTGFWFVLIAFAIFVRALWQTLQGDLRSLRWRSLDWTSVAVVIAGGVVLLVHEAFG